MTVKKSVYHDSSEDFLLEFFKHKPESKLTKEINKILINPSDWPTRYHLSYQRTVLLDWFNFGKNKSILEIGAGCGAITRLFTQKLKTVHALELEAKRAKIIKSRFKDKKNLKVIQADFSNFQTKKKYDYVSLIGVLEYAGSFFINSFTQKDYSYKPFIEMVKKAKSFLKPNGQLIIAIENKLGIRYISGCTEDHYDILNESLEDYPHYNGIRTFSKNELKKILIKAGFKEKPNFYYPFPDYKLPKIILNQKLLYKTSTVDIFPSPDFAKNRFFLFNEILLAQTFKKAKILSQFSNSFLIFISNK
jgi:SAM-dependent methyltransferase